MKTASRFSVIACALLLVACGGGDKPAESSTPAATPAPTTAAPATPVATNTLNGQTEFAVCAACHGQNGEGMPGVYPPLAGSEWVTGDPKVAIAIVLRGLQGPITVKGQSYNNVMVPWSALSDAQISAILTYARSSWGNNASAVSIDEVAAVRAATASRTTSWTVEELKAAKLQ
jgi:mono/diheme cytochrome c family protein